MGQKQKTEREKERPNEGNNNGQATHGARKPPGPKEMVKVWIQWKSLKKPLKKVSFDTE